MSIKLDIWAFIFNNKLGESQVRFVTSLSQSQMCLFVEVWGRGNLPLTPKTSTFFIIFAIFNYISSFYDGNEPINLKKYKSKKIGVTSHSVKV